MLHYIICDSTVILTKKKYSSWREIQAEYNTYVTSLGPFLLNELLEYFADEYKDETEWPFSKNEIHIFWNDTSECLKKHF